MVIKLRFKANLFIPINICLFVVACSAPLNISNNRPYAEHSRFISSEKQTLYGINGHSVRANRGEYVSQYNQFSISEQVELLKKLGVGLYRTDIYIDETGFFNDPDSPKKFEELLDSLHDNNIELLPVISTYPWMKNYDDAKEPFFIGTNWDYKKLVSHLKVQDYFGPEYIQSLDIWTHYYSRGRITGEKFGKKYGDKLTYYNTGNEIGYYISKKYPYPDLPIQNPSGEDTDKYFLSTYGGDDLLDFFPTEEHARRMVSSVAYVKGLIDGIKSEDKEAIAVVSDGKANLGFFKFLEYMNVDYDIIGWNWYVDGFNSNLLELNGKNVYQELSRQFNHKPIWITETNRYAGSRNYSEESVYRAEIDQANKIKNYVAEFSTLEKVEAVIVYELLDQEYKFESRWEDYYGLITSPFPDKSFARLKPAFDMYRYTIEELKYGNEDFVYFALSQALKGNLNDQLLIHWNMKFQEMSNKELFLKNLLDESENYIQSEVKKEYKKDELNKMVDSIFQMTLERKPTKRERRYSRRYLSENINPQNLQIELMLSAEYWQNAIWSGYERRTNFLQP